MKKFFSRYHPTYLRSLAYMLQASEYDTKDFLRWHRRVGDFRDVEKRQALVFTIKSALFYGLGWIIACAIFGFCLGLVRFLPPALGAGLSLVLAVLAPFLVAYGLAGASVLARPIQRFYEGFSLSRMEKKLRGHRGVKIAIAGSYGKTTTREILRAVLGAERRVAAPPENHNTPLALAHFVDGLDGSEDVLIFELGEYYPGDVGALARAIQPDIGIITGVNEAHLERFGAIEKTTAAVFELADELAGKPVYVNADNLHALRAARAGHVLYGREGAEYWKVAGSETSLAGTSLTLRHEGRTITAKSGLLGMHHLGPLALSADIATRLGVSDEGVARGIEATKPFEHRLELKKLSEGVVLLDDSYNGNPDGTMAVIDFLKTLAGRKIYVTPGLVEAGNRMREVHEKIGKRLAGADVAKVFLIRTSVSPCIERGLAEAGFTGEVRYFDDMPSALSTLPSFTVPG